MQKLKFIYPLIMLLLCPVTNAGVTKAEFVSIIKEFKTYFTVPVRDKGFSFRVEANWNTHKRDASIKIPNKNVILKVTGGFAKDPLLTPDALRLVMCHEMGHFFGGAPKLSSGHWSSAEGQADYYSTSKCIKNFILNDVENRVIKASLVLAHMVTRITGEDFDQISVSRHDPFQARKTSTIHNNAQCRLDTLMAGFYCDNYSEFDDVDPDIGACLYKEDITGPLKSRPRCWYRSNEVIQFCQSQESFSFNNKQEIPLLNVQINPMKIDGSTAISIYTLGTHPQDYTNEIVFNDPNGDIVLNQNSIEIKKHLVHKMIAKSLMLQRASRKPTLIEKNGRYQFSLKCHNY